MTEDEYWEEMRERDAYEQQQEAALEKRECCRKHWEEDHGASAMRFGDVLMNPVGMGMMLCSKCGNKRCPRATDCALECTGSNETGQPGSIYG